VRLSGSAEGFYRLLQPAIVWQAFQRKESAMSVQDLFDRIVQLPETEPGTVAVPPPEIVGFHVRMSRGQMNWKISTLADFARVSVSTVERIERGEKVSEDALDRIAAAFGFSPGYYSEPRKKLTTAAAAEKMAEDYGGTEAVSVEPFSLHRHVREASECHALIVLGPNLSSAYDDDVAKLKEWMELAAHVLSDTVEPAKDAPSRRREFSDSVIAHVRAMERRGLTILFGSMSAPWPGLTFLKVAVLAISPKLSDPGASKRRAVLVNRKAIGLPTFFGKQT
jgi:transcriptional regulator with XRE-family HTH domain